MLLMGCSFDRSGLAPSSGRDAAVDAAGAADAPEASDAPAADAPVPAPPCPDDDALVACYRFEGANAGNEPRDESSYHNDGTSSEVAFILGPAGHGNAMSFSATASAHVPDSASLDVKEVTMELWLYVRTLPASGARAGILDDNGEYGLFLAHDGGVRCAIGSATDIGLTIPTGTWTHVACTFAGGVVRLYQDGQSGPTLNTAATIPGAPTDGLGLGQNVPTGDHLDGAIDDVRIWKTARSREAICEDAAPLCH
jgi:Concanavalin A-like lectin/glucanases superfamily